jgi:phosphomannomutase
MSHRFHPSILREYDIRGIVGKTLGADDARAIGLGFAARLQRQGGGKVAVCRDGRLSSPMLEAALIEGLTQGGCDVVRLGLGPTPMLYYAEASAEDVKGGIQVTGSHNPGDHNGFKIVLGGHPFFGEDIRTLCSCASQTGVGTRHELGALARRSGIDVEGGVAGGGWVGGGGAEGGLVEPGVAEGVVEQREVMGGYIERLLEALRGLDQTFLAGLRIGWDAGNGAAGPALETMVARLPGEHHLLYTEVNGHFPHHHPDPTLEENLADLRRLVAEKQLDFGVAFDGDGDRLGVVDGLGRSIAGDQLLMIYAEDLLRQHPGAMVIADVKSSQAVFDRIAELGGQPLMWKTGHSLIKSKMKQTGALLGGEMTGHVFFADSWYGFDDALYAALRLIAASARLGKSVTELRDALPSMINTPELRFPVEESRKFPVIDEVTARLSASGARMNTIDGVRVTTQDGWWLLRASNTQEGLVARAESGDEAGLARLLGQVDAQLAASGVSR